MAKLSLAEIKEQLESLKGWQSGENAISKQFVFPSFKEAMSFVNAVAELAEAADHHPDILIAYRRVTLTLWTHTEGGVTGRDLKMAKQIEQLPILKPQGHQ